MITNLPTEILCKILLFCDYKSRCAALCSAKLFHVFTKSELASLQVKWYLNQEYYNRFTNSDAVRQDGRALQFVKNKTPEICLTAVKEDGAAANICQESNS